MPFVALRSHGVRVVEVADLGPHAHYVPSVSVLLVDAALMRDDREVIADQCLQHIKGLR